MDEQNNDEIIDASFGESKSDNDEDVTVIHQDDLYEIIDLPPMRGGRRTKCTPEFTESFCDLVSQGLNFKDACAVSGIHTDTYYSWRTRGIKRLAAIEKAEEMGMVIEDDPYEDVFVSFYQAVEKAIPLRKHSILQKILRAADDPRNWTAAAWYLERVHPEEFGRKMKIEKVDWRSEVIALIKEGTVTFQMIANDLGEDEAIRLFERSGKRIPATIQAREDS